MTRVLILFSLLFTITSTLSGCAATIVGGAAAGASAAHDRRTTGTLIDDQIIEAKVIEAARKDGDLWELGHINATSFNNIVLLTGELPSASLKERLGLRVASIQKVRQVHNEVAIAAPSSVLTRSSDTWITGKVKTLLFNDHSLDATRVKVVTENSVVYLMGLVTRSEADAATEVARHVSGVQRVVKVFEYTE